MSRMQMTGKLLYKIAKAYYEDCLTQQQIANQFGLSRIRVSRLLNRARTDGTVQITISPPQTSNADLEREIERVYQIKEAVVVTCSENDLATVVSEIGTEAANTLIRCLQGQEVVGISWGHSVLSAVNSLPTLYLPELRIVQITGGLGEQEARTHGADLARRAAQSLGARLRLLYAPGIVKNKVVRDALVKDSQIADTIKLAGQADVALVGVGIFKPPSTLSGADALSEEEIADLEAKGAVGDIALQFFNKDGKKVNAKVNKRIVGADLDDIRKIPRVIGVVAGQEKLDAIQAALMGKLIDVLLTDQNTAARLLERS